MLPETSKNLRREQQRITSSEYAFAIAVALKQEFGSSRHAVKHLVKHTGASERTVQNWLSGVRGPSGLHLILLAQHLASVRTTILLLTGQSAHPASSIDEAVTLIYEAIALLLGSK